MKHPQLIVHVGFRKTASTLLQTHVFPNLAGLDYITTRAGNSIYDALSLIDYPNGEKAREASLRDFSAYCGRSSVPVLISRESFIMPSCSLDMPFDRPRKFREPDIVLSDIENMTPNVRILLFIREQRSWLESWYQERVKRYETRHYAEMLNSPDFAPILQMLNYDQIVSDLHSRFGPERVHVIPFEHLKANRDEFYRRLGNALGVGIPVIDTPIVKGRVKPGTLVARRTTNKALVWVAKRTGGNTGLDRALFRGMKRIYAYDFIFSRAIPQKYNFGKVEQDVLDMYSRSNARVSEQLGMDLKALGYA